MRKRNLVIWMMVPVFAFSLAFWTSCAKEGLRETPGKPSLKGPVYPAKGALPKEDQVYGKGGDWSKKIAEMREQCRKEMAAKTRQELRKQFEEEKIYFAFDKANLTQGSKVVLMRKATYMLEIEPDIKVLIEGHCDERGSVEYNLALGQRRAEAAMKYLVKLGVDPDRIKLISYGKERPIDPAHNEEAWAKNRRCEFRIVK